MFELNDFDSIQISLASPEKIRGWSHGEVLKPETINYRTSKPEPDGLFCERIFGPVHDYECHCGKYKRVRHEGVTCDKCGVDVTTSKVRRERMGHIELAAPVAHIWYFRGVPSRISLLLNMQPKELEQVVYFAAYVVLDPGNTDETGLVKKQVITDREYYDLVDKIGEGKFRAEMGAEAIKELLQEIDLESESKMLKEVVNKSTGQKRIHTVKRLEIVEAFRISGNKPEWMVLDVLPVLPPDLRPMVPLDGGRYATSDLNDLYRRIINRNNRLKDMLQRNTPAIIIRNEKRMLQEAVDALIDNGRRGKAVSGPGNRELKSLSGMLRGKQGRFRQNLLGKRVDYSGRSVIVVGPELKMYQCGLPKDMAKELFKPFIMRILKEREICRNIKSARRYVDQGKPQIWDILDEVIKDHPVLLNRAPTLHRLGIQAFEPVLVEGNAIKLHPLACSAFNADFDGDQMAVHLPLSIEAQTEARMLMLSTNNILKLSDGRPIVSPTQDMVLGAYYLTIQKDGDKGEGKVFKDANEAMMAYEDGDITLQSKIKVRVTKEIDGKTYSKIVNTSLGRIIFNEAIPQDIGFAKRNTPEDELDFEIDFLVGKKQLSQIVDHCFECHGAHDTAMVLDEIKRLGYKYSTIGALTTSVFDMTIPEKKKEYIEEAEEKIVKIEKQAKRGLLSEEDRYNQTIKVWRETASEVEEALKGALDKFNPIMMMADSGARGSMSQIRQLSGMRGLMSDPTGRIIELPVKSNFREGLTVLEYFISSHGGRKGLADTALKTAESGYLTRRLVDVSHNVIVVEDDCGDTRGVTITPIMSGKNVIEPLKDRIAGRYTIEDIFHPETGELIVKKDTMLSNEQAEAIEKAGITSVRIRSTLTCKTRNGVCSKCYGKDMSSNNPVRRGEAVGIIAAQSIGEPGTQLTMRTFHTGGIATSDDITQGLPRVEELFEARNPKGMAIIAEKGGKCEVYVQNDKKEKNFGKTIVKVINGDDVTEYALPIGAKVKVATGDEIEAGTALMQGSINPQDMLRARGVKGVQDYITKEVQSAYRTAGVEINDKHIEIIVRQMLRKVRIETQGDTNMLPGTLVDIFDYEDEQSRVLENGGVPASAKRTLQGITKTALATDSFLSAASFQETAKVLTDAAIKNKVDPLLGLKENVIIGKLIPAGTGNKYYKHFVAGEVREQPTVTVDNVLSDIDEFDYDDEI